MKLSWLTVLTALGVAGFVLVGGAGEAFFGVAFISGLVISAKALVTKQSITFNRSTLWLAAALFGFWLLKLVGVAWAPNRSMAISDLGTHSHFLMLLPLVVFFRKVPQLKQALVFGVCVSMLVGLGLAFWRAPNLLDWSIHNRFEGGTGNALILGVLTTVYSVWLAFLLLRPLQPSNVPQRVGIVACYFSSLAVLVATGGRMPILATALLTVTVVVWCQVFLRTSFSPVSSRKSALGILLAIVAIAALAIQFTPIGKRFGAAADEIAAFEAQSNTSTPVGIRLGMQRAALQAFAENPILGSGSGSAITSIKSHAERLYGSAKFIDGYRHLHNQYLQTLVEHGLVGLALLLFIGIASVRLFLNVKDDFVKWCGVSLVLAYALLGISNITIKHGLQNSFLLTMLAILVVLAEQAERTERI